MPEPEPRWHKVRDWHAVCGEQRIGRSGMCRVFGKEAFIGLDPDDRQVLADWLAIASTGTIDRVVDFARRPWKITGLEVVIGIFEVGNPGASWLLVRYEQRWVLARVGDGTKDAAVSKVCESLAEALRLLD